MSTKVGSQQEQTEDNTSASRYNHMRIHMDDVSIYVYDKAVQLSQLEAERRAAATQVLVKKHIRHIWAFTETKKQSPNTGARANNTLHK